MSQKHPFEDELKAVINGFKMAKLGIAEILNHPDLTIIKNRIETDITKIQNYVNGLVGYSENIPAPGQVTTDFAPVTQFFGETISRPLPVKASDLSPEDAERQQFLTKRNDLYERFLSMSDDEVFAVMREPKGETLLRSVAKKAGVEDFREVAIDVEFIENVKDLITEQMATEGTVEMANKFATFPGDEDDDDIDLDDDLETTDDEEELIDNEEVVEDKRLLDPEWESHLGKTPTEEVKDSKPAEEKPAAKKGGRKSSK